LKQFFKEYPLFLSIIALVLFGTYEHTLAETLTGNIVGFLVIFVVIIYSSMSVAHHAELLAEKFGEPYGTMILTMSAVIVEIVIISIMMLHEENPTLARDTIYSAIMLDINGLLGFAAIVGGLKYGEQPYNVDSSNSYLSMLMVALGVAMVIPDFIKPEFYDAFMLFNVVIFILLYLVFTRVQLKDHRYFFQYKNEGVLEEVHTHAKEGEEINALYHTLLLVVSIVMIGLLSEILAVFMSNDIEYFGLPMALSAVGVAVISASPELITAVRAALDNRMQTVINIALGASLATVLLTIPAVIVIGMVSGLEVALGLTPIQGVMLGLTLLVSMINFSDGETNMLEGFLHVILFVLFAFLLFV
jgi:Ca2+:H+ antiporter